MYFPFCVLLGDQPTACGELQHLLIKCSIFTFHVSFFAQPYFFLIFRSLSSIHCFSIFFFSTFSSAIICISPFFFYIAVFLFFLLFSHVTLRCQGCRVQVFSTRNAQIELTEWLNLYPICLCFFSQRAATVKSRKTAPIKIEAPIRF